MELLLNPPQEQVEEIEPYVEVIVEEEPVEVAQDEDLSDEPVAQTSEDETQLETTDEVGIVVIPPP